MKKMYILFLSVFLLFAAFSAPVSAAEEEAEELAVTVTAENGKKLARLTDGRYDTAVSLDAGSALTVAPKDPEAKIYGLYLAWAAPPGRWAVSYNGAFSGRGTDGFLHEYVPVAGGAESVTLTPREDEVLCYVKAYSSGALPGDVQVWEPACKRADLLLFSTHADDEILFFGGVLAEYAGERGLAVQVAYFSNYFGGTVVREHEKLDGLWACGVRNYPVNGPFPDQYAGTLAQAEKIYGRDEALAFSVEQIRRFRPQVCVAQDVDGEYGHGTHMLTAAAAQEAAERSMDAACCPESAEEYGTWDVPKTYLHLWKENPVRLDCRKPLSAFGGRTALEVAAEAYKKHVSQQWCWFYVSDDYAYSIADFGLYRTTVGADTGNDLMEHLTSYAEQERAERLEAERLAQEAAAQRAAEEAARKEAEAEQAREEPPKEARESARFSAFPFPIIAGAGILVLAGLFWLFRKK